MDGSWDGGWRRVAPITPMIQRADARIGVGLRFRDGLASWQDVTFGSALGHSVSQAAPVGTMHGVLRYRSPGGSITPGGGPLLLRSRDGGAPAADGTAPRPGGAPVPSRERPSPTTEAAPASGRPAAHGPVRPQAAGRSLTVARRVATLPIRTLPAMRSTGKPTVRSTVEPPAGAPALPVVRPAPGAPAAGVGDPLPALPPSAVPMPSERAGTLADQPIAPVQRAATPAARPPEVAEADPLPVVQPGEPAAVGQPPPPVVQRAPDHPAPTAAAPPAAAPRPATAAPGPIDAAAPRPAAAATPPVAADAGGSTVAAAPVRPVDVPAGRAETRLAQPAPPPLPVVQRTAEEVRPSDPPRPLVADDPVRPLVDGAAHADGPAQRTVAGAPPQAPPVRPLALASGPTDSPPSRGGPATGVGAPLPSIPATAVLPWGAPVAPPVVPAA
ncbi:MAG TPA: hypothetical protein VGD12_10990, partial [Blastococcus sp.]